MKIQIAEHIISENYIKVPNYENIPLTHYLVTNFKIQENTPEHHKGILIFLEWNFFVKNKNTNGLIADMTYRTFIKVLEVSNYERDISFIETILRQNYENVYADFKTRFITVKELLTQEQLRTTAIKFIEMLVDHGNYPPLDLL